MLGDVGAKYCVQLSFHCLGAARVDSVLLAASVVIFM